jgi:hypothetical protein
MGSKSDRSESEKAMQRKAVGTERLDSPSSSFGPTSWCSSSARRSVQVRQADRTKMFGVRLGDRGARHLPKTRSYVECRMKTASPKRRRSRRSSPTISAVEKTAVRIMRKLYEATGGQPQRWESLGNLGAVKADAAGIGYAVEQDWLIISGGLHSVSLTEAGRRRVK